jgi:hypothetical protein
MAVPGAPELPELRKQLGNYGDISTYQSLYRWLNQLAQHGVDELAPQYSKRGGSGASLDVHTKQLIWGSTTCAITSRLLPISYGY